jgi:3-deoxy-D-manno-octulosonate 8-phosphate phosphatase (KDO 8-P phosphatase)
MHATARIPRAARPIQTALARSLRLAIFDVDGVMTDGRLYIGANGEEMKAFHTLDGHGLKTLAAQGVELAILSGRRARCVELRAAELGIRHVIQGAGDKLPAYEALLAQLGVAAHETSYMGDDVVDVPVLERCGLAISVPDAPAQVKRVAHLVTRRPGGFGAVREACDLIVRARGQAGSR